MNSESDVASPLTESKKGGFNFFVLFSKFGDKVSCLLKMLLSCAYTNKTLRWFVVINSCWYTVFIGQVSV